MVSTGLSDLEKGILQWQAETFPQSTPQGVMIHLQREFAELAEIYYLRGTDASVDKLMSELADIFILSVSLADHFERSLINAVIWKMKENKARKWAEPDEEGVIEHVRE